MSLLAALLILAPAPQTGTVEVPFRRAETAIIVDATINGRKVALMFDTGYGGTAVVDQSVDIGKPTGKATLQDFVGTLQVPTVKPKTLAVGGMSIPVQKDMLVVQQSSDYSAAYGMHCDGILGFEALKNTIFTIDNEHRKFVFHPSTYDITAKKPDGKKTFLAKLLPIGHSSLEMYVTAPNGKTMTLALDTGNSFYATTHRDVLERIGLWEKDKPHKYPSQSGVASGSVESWLFQMPPLDIFGVPTPPSVWSIIDLPSSSAEGDGTVGDGFLKHFNITVDYDKRRVLLEKWDPEIANGEDGDVGLSAAYNPNTKRTQVVLVAPDSPAAAAGIKVGDSVLMVDGDDLVHVDYDRFRKLMSGKIGTSVRLAISQNGGLKRVEMKRTSLVNVGPEVKPVGK